MVNIDYDILIQVIVLLLVDLMIGDKHQSLLQQQIVLVGIKQLVFMTLVLVGVVYLNQHLLVVLDLMVVLVMEIGGLLLQQCLLRGMEEEYRH